VELSHDHKPDDPTEWDRIESAGGKVIWCHESGLYRINGNMALSRAIGDRSERPWICADPDVLVIPIHPHDDEFIVLATDGLWDVMSNDDVIDLIHFLLRQAIEPNQIADFIVEEALMRGSTDNITVVIVFLNSKRRW
jgi:serine/threonine protein phosphatase PrpC